MTVDPQLQAKIRQSIHVTAMRPRSSSWIGGAIAAAAVALLCLGSVIAYQFGHLRWTAASQEAYIARISQHVSGMMRTGLGDHVHCAVFRKSPGNPPSLERLAEDMGPEYKDLINVVQQNVPAGYRVSMAHRCSYHRRKFIHVTASNGSKLISLVISRKEDGESFENDHLTPVLSPAGVPVFESAVQRFDIAGFETRDHLVYVVSDLKSEQNRELLIGFAQGVRDVLRRVEL